MDDQQRPNLYQHNPHYNATYLSNQSASMNDPRRGSCSRGPARLSSTGSHPSYYPLHMPTVPFDRNFYQRNIYGLPHMQPTALPGVPATGLNQINPVLMVSPNDNNNCNRNRAASMSSVPMLEVGSFCYCIYNLTISNMS